MRWGSSIRVTVPAALLAASLVVVPSGGAQEFSRAEVRVLDSGEPVRHPRSQNRGGHEFVGGTSWRVIPRPLDEVWRGVNDERRLCAMLPQCVRQRVVTSGEQRRLMRFTHEYGPITASYHVNVTLDEDEHDLSFRLDRSRPNDVRDAWGFMTLEPYTRQPGHTLVTWGVMADPGSQIMTSLLGGAVQSSLLRVPDEMYDYLMGPGRQRYR